VNALKRALENGVIDVVVSDHYPQDIESKDLEFDLADHGIVALQTAFNCLVTAIPKIDAEKIGECLAENPRAVLGLKPVLIKEEEDANLTLFTLSGKTTLSEKQIVSKSKNTPFIGEALQGRVIGAINNDKLVLN
jgi:dihydroorotase